MWIYAWSYVYTEWISKRRDACVIPVAEAESLLNIETRLGFKAKVGRELRNLVAGFGIYSSFIYGCANSATGLIVFVLPFRVL